MTKRRAAAQDLIPILYDLKLMRPGCVLLQVVAGADRDAFMKYFGGSDRWLVSPTPGMKVYRATAKQWEALSRRNPKGGKA